MNKLTIVTALFDLGREDLNSGFERSFEHYITAFLKLLNIDLPLVIYTTQYIADDVIWKTRKPENTKVIIKSLEEFDTFPFKNQIDDIRNNPEWYNTVGWLKDSPQASLEYYNPLIMSKQFWLNDTTHFNYFNSDYFLWVDAGISNTIGNPPDVIHQAFADKIISENNQKFIFDSESVKELRNAFSEVISENSTDKKGWFSML